jgi:hypothetical protein
MAFPSTTYRPEWLNDAWTYAFPNFPKHSTCMAKREPLEKSNPPQYRLKVPIRRRINRSPLAPVPQPIVHSLTFGNDLISANSPQASHSAFFLPPPHPSPADRHCRAENSPLYRPMRPFRMPVELFPQGGTPPTHSHAHVSRGKSETVNLSVISFPVLRTNRFFPLSMYYCPYEGCEHKTLQKSNMVTHTRIQCVYKNISVRAHTDADSQFRREAIHMP